MRFVKVIAFAGSLFFSGLQGQAQTTLFSEGFETLPYGFVASGSASWSASSTLKTAGNYSDSARIVNSGDSAVLTSQAFSTTGMTQVVLKFKHICKIDFFDAAYPEVSINNGNTWTRLDGSHYQGAGQFVSFNNQFKDGSYMDWMPLNNSAIPNNSWWKEEVFDLSALASGNSQVKVRFTLKDMNANGGSGAYGWFIDEVQIIGGSFNLVPPQIFPSAGNPAGQVAGTGPFVVEATILDADGIQSARLIYTAGMVTDTIVMNKISASLYSGIIPSMPYQSSVCYKMEATDSSQYQNKSVLPAASCISFTNYKAPVTVQVGTAALNNYAAPMYNSLTTSADKYSQHISLFTPAEIGIKGNIQSLIWEKANASGYTLGNGILKIYLKHTSQTTLSTTSGTYATELQGSTLVFEDTLVTLPASAGWQTFVFNKGNFTYNGTDNLMILVDWYRPGTLTANYINWYLTNNAGKAVTFYGSTPAPSTVAGSGQRPNTKFVIDQVYFNHDASIKAITTPSGTFISALPVPVIVSLKNSGQLPLTKATINWSVNGNIQTPYYWTGNLQMDMIAHNLNLGSYLFGLGSNTIKVWSSMPNDSMDMFPGNDTLTTIAFGCNQILNGTYTVGSSSSDFQTLGDLFNALYNCGISGPCTFRIMPGTYTDRLRITDSIPGLSATNTIIFTSFNNNATSVTLKPPAASSTNNYVINLQGARYITIDKITLITESTTAGNCITFTNNARYNTISYCRLQMPYGENTSVMGIVLAGGCNYNTLNGNSITNGYKSISATGTSGSRVVGLTAKNNTLTDGSRYGADISYHDSLVFEGNRVYCSYSAPSSSRYGVYVTQSQHNRILGNRIHMHVTGYAYSIYYTYNTDASASEASIIANNFLLQTGTSTVYGNHALNLQNSSNVKIYNNSMMVATGNSNAGTINFEQASSGVYMYNNVIANMAGGLAINHYSSAGQLLAASNYNNLYTTGSTLVKWNSSVLVPVTGGIAALTAATGKDSNSIIVNPYFYSLTDLHSFSPMMNNAGIPFPEVTTDYDGQPRSLTTPDIGADEYSVTPLDAGISLITSPGTTLVQGDVVPVKALISNYGTTALTSCTVKYTVGQSTPQVTTWTGNLATGATDTVTLPNLTVPALSFTLSVYTDLTGDTLHFNDTISGLFYGSPLVDARITGLTSPTGGCNPGVETVTITLKNEGQLSITSGLSASYQLTGSSAVITEPVTQSIAASGTITFSFSTQVNLTTIVDSVFILKAWVSHNQDPNSANDTLTSLIQALAPLPVPQVSDTTISYGQAVTLTATSSYPVEWYNQPIAGTKLAIGAQYTTPPLFDTTTYYVRANTNIPSGTFYIGQGTNESGQYEFPNPFGKAMGGNKTQYLILASEMAAQGYSAGPISSVAFFSNGAMGTIAGMEISLGTTTQSQATTTFFTSPMTIIFSGTVDITAGWFDITCTAPYSWDGVSNLIVQTIAPSGMTLINPPLVYDSTLVPMTVFNAGSSSSPTGTTTLKRHNIRIKTLGTAGCSSPRVPLKVIVPPLQRDIMMKAFVQPISGCGIGTTPVTVQLMNHGYDTLFGGIQVRYKIGNGAYSTPETISTTILPYATYNHTFAAQASLPSGPVQQNYLLTAVASMTGDMYLLNDTLKSDTITSVYTPTPIVANPVTIPYGTQAILAPSASDTLYWYHQPAAGTPFFTGSPYTTPLLYDTAQYWVESRFTSPLLSVQTGTGTTYNSSSAYPSPYGSTQYGAKHQFLIRASELTALGLQKGMIQSVGFNVAAPGTAVLQNYTIKLGHTSQNTIGQFEPNLTAVFASPSYTVTNGINTHPVQVPFEWDGVSNLMVETCFKNSSNGSISQVYYTNAGFTASMVAVGTASFDCSTTTSAATYTMRPNIYLKLISYGACTSSRVMQQVNVSGIPAIDASVSQILSPLGTSVSGTPVPVSVELKNYGTSPLTSAPIWYQVNNGTPAMYNWSGSLARLATATVNIGNITFAGGIETLKVWVAKSGDNTHTNDTTQTTLTVCMQGIYTIGQGKRFTTLNDAVNALTTSGVCGHTYFDIDPGIYAERLVIPTITGAGAGAAITFRSSTLDSSDVTIQELTTQSNPYIINFTNAAWVNLKHLTITANGSAYGYAVKFDGNCSNIQITNSTLNGASTSTSGNAAAVYSMSTTLQNITIEKNVITNGYSGIYLSGASGVGNQKKVTIAGNQITGFYQIGVYAYYQDSLEIRNNTIISGTVNQYYYGVRSYYLSNTFKIHGNTMILSPSSYGYGVDLNYSNGTASNYGLVYNNMISLLTGTGGHNGLYSVSNNYVRFAYNSVYVNGTGITQRAMGVGAGSNNEILNNNFMCGGQGYAFYTTIPGTITMMDYNNYYVSPTSGTFVHWGGPINTFAAFQAYDPSKNVHSVNVDPVYKAVDNLHADNILINAKALPVAGISTDIDGQARNATTPDIGADEFFPAPYDLSVMQILNPSISSCGFTATDTVSVKIRNAGENAWNFVSSPVTVKVFISGALSDTLVTVINNGTLLSGNTQTIVVNPAYNLSAIGHYIISSTVISTQDTVPGNNGCPEITVVSLPTISTFPYSENFEIGYDHTFGENSGTDASVSVSGLAANNSSYGLQFQGGGWVNWGTTPSNVDQAFSNTSHIADAITCQVIPGSSTQLKMKFDLKQTYVSLGQPNTSWFRVMIYANTGAQYLKNTNGDSVFRAITQSGDPFVTHIFDLQPYASQPFNIILESVCRIRYGEGGGVGDNAFVDNFVLWNPVQNDASVQQILNPELNYSKVGNQQYVKVVAGNFGTQTITSLPLLYRVGNAVPVLETFQVSIPSNSFDTLTFTVPFIVQPGMQTVQVYTTLPGDGNLLNDTISKEIRGLNTFPVPYSDSFEGSQEWVPTGTYQQWQLGTPSTALINTTHSGSNAWATLLNQNYKPNAIEILYSPYFVIPPVPDTATVSFWQWMSVVTDQAYGIIQYTTNLGAQWNNLGYIGSTDGTNWYNSNVNGTHSWSTVHAGWTQSSHILYPSVFNTGMPVQFRFILYTTSYTLSSDGWAIDDFSINIPPPQHDAHTLAIVTPAVGTAIGDQVQVQLKAVNKGVQTITSLPLLYRVGNNVPVAETWSGSAATGDTLSFTFSTPFIGPVNSYNLCVWSALPGDLNTLNDTVCNGINATPGKRDAGITAITAPTGQVPIGGTIEVKTVIQNFGTDTLYSIPLEYRANNLLIGTETFNGTLLPGATVPYTFATTYTSPAGQTNVCVKTLLTGDVNGGNDEKCEAIVATGLEESGNGGILVGQNIPNPASDFTILPVFTGTGGIARVIITDLTGKITTTYTFEAQRGNNAFHIPTANLATGLYLYSVELNGQKVTRKMAVTR